MCTEHRRRLGCWLLTLFMTASASADTWNHERGELELGDTPERIVALNWAATETLLLLGVTPVGMADRDGYPTWVQSPPLPDGIHNVGTRSSPSLEAIAELEPDLIVTSGQLAPAWEQLHSIAPTYVFSVYDQGADPYARARNLLLTLGNMLNREPQAQDVLDSLTQSMAEDRQRLAKAGLANKPVALVTFIDERHLRVNAPNGLFQHALDGLGLTNAWTEPGNFWGFSMVGLDALAKLSDARIVVISPTAPELPDALEHSPFWTHLPAVKRHEIYQIAPVWAYGGVNAVGRLAQLVTDALLDDGHDIVQ